MKTRLASIALVCCALRLFAQTKPAAPAVENKAYLDYINRYKNAAVREMYRVGIPASITLSQAILESGGGTSELAKQANNHFGIKCGVNWYGKTYNKVDDATDAGGSPVTSCFRKYGDAGESFYDHSEFICDPQKFARYGFLFYLAHTDYEAWARGLESAGYAGSAGYADKLINLIQRYALFQYDQPEIQPSDSVKFEVLYRVSRVNRKKTVFSRANERMEDIAMLFRLDVKKLAEYNDLAYAPGLPLPPNTRVFIEEKRKKWRGRLTFHVMQEGQTMFDLSQRYGIRLAELLERNGLKPGQEPAVGEPVRLRGRPLSGGTALRLREAEPEGVDGPGAPGGKG